MTVNIIDNLGIGMMARYPPLSFPNKCQNCSDRPCGFLMLNAELPCGQARLEGAGLESRE